MTMRALRPTRVELVSAVASGVLFGVAFPPFRLFFPVFVCLVPLAVALARQADAGAGIGTAWRMATLFVVVGCGINLYWLAIALQIYTDLAFLAYVGALLGLTIVMGAAIAVIFVIRRATRLPMALVLPIGWIAAELALNYLSDLAFPWLPLGLAMAKSGAFAQAADLSGVRGVSFWIAVIDGLIADAWLARHDRRAVVRRAIAIAVLFVAEPLYGWWRIETIRFRPVAPIAVVQPDIPQEDKWQAQYQGRIIGIITDLTRRRLTQHDARLVVWPEAALPGFWEQHPDWADTLLTLGRDYHTPLIFGVIDLDYRGLDDYDYYNAAMFADSTGHVGGQPPYHKTYLVPIVERVPFLNPRWFAKISRYFGGFGRGGTPVPYTLPFGKVGVLICYESIFPQRSREYRNHGASVLLNITNDAWFGRSLAPYQHEAHLAVRAIENRVGIVRAANTGISEYIDPLGRAHGATALFVPATRTYDVETTDLRTVYDRVGDWVGATSVVATLGLLAVALLRRRG